MTWRSCWATWTRRARSGAAGCSILLASWQCLGSDIHFKLHAQVEATILSGPRTNLGSFLKALARLEASTAFLSQHRCLLLLSPTT